MISLNFISRYSVFGDFHIFVLNLHVLHETLTIKSDNILCVGIKAQNNIDMNVFIF